MSDLRAADGVRDRIDQYLRESGTGGDKPRVVPLTGDASDRKYFRIIPADGPSIVLALHAGPIDFASLPFANVGTLMQRIPLPVPALLGRERRAAIAFDEVLREEVELPRQLVDVERDAVGQVRVGAQLAAAALQQLDERHRLPVKRRMFRRR